MKEFKAKIKYKDKINTMLVSGEDEESVINDITDSDCRQTPRFF